MPIQHVVAFKFKPSAAADQLADVARAFVALKQQCVRPAPSGERYIARLVGGRQDSSEGADQGLQHVYLVEFEVRERPPRPLSCTARPATAVRG